jgi:hypothetical protein
LTAQGDGTISGQYYSTYNPYRGVRNEIAVFNGPQIIDTSVAGPSSVPEPTSLGLLAVATPLLMRRRRNRRV